MLKTGEIIGDKYHVESLLGKGGMGTVYLCREMKSLSFFAVKEIKKDKRFYSVEATMLKRLKHKSIPRLYETFETPSCFYMVIDYIQGETLKEKVLKGTLGQLEIMRILLDLADVLEYLHSQSPAIIYGDLKPNNVIIKPNGEIVLIDYGISREYNSEDKQSEVYMGSLGYAAPEQYGHGCISPTADIYGLGAVLYYIFLKKGPENAMEAIKERNFPDTIPLKYRYIIRKSLQIEPLDRFSSIEEFRMDLLARRDFSEDYRMLSLANSMEEGKTIEFFRMPEYNRYKNSRTAGIQH